VSQDRNPNVTLGQQGVIRETQLPETQLPEQLARVRDRIIAAFDGEGSADWAVLGFRGDGLFAGFGGLRSNSDADCAMAVGACSFALDATHGALNELLKQSRFYVGCETSDDLPYIIQKVGEDNLVIGTDYGHADSATELCALDGILHNSSLNSSVARKIVGENAKVLYGL
jgi:hypothetical protein